jgi:hypothetical protein
MQSEHGNEHSSKMEPRLGGLSFGGIRGLLARDRRRDSLIEHVCELPRVPYLVVMLGNRVGFLQSFFNKGAHSAPPRIWYRLVSLGQPYEPQKRGGGFSVVQECLRNGGVLTPLDGVGCDIEQVLVVNRKARFVYEVATKRGDNCWQLRGSLKRYWRDSCFVFVMPGGVSEYMRCRDVPIVRRSFQ